MDPNIPHDNHAGNDHTSEAEKKTEFNKRSTNMVGGGGTLPLPLSMDKNLIQRLDLWLASGFMMSKKVV